MTFLLKIVLNVYVRVLNFVRISDSCVFSFVRGIFPLCAEYYGNN